MVLRQVFAHFERLAASMSRTELRVQTPNSLFLRFTLMKSTTLSAISRNRGKPCYLHTHRLPDRTFPQSGMVSLDTYTDCEDCSSQALLCLLSCCWGQQDRKSVV